MKTNGLSVSVNRTDRNSVLVKTDVCHPRLTVDAVKAVIDPLNWSYYGVPFYWEITQLDPPVDSHGWSRIIEEFGPARMKTALKYWKAEVETGAVVNYDLDDGRAHTADSGLVLMDRGYITVMPRPEGGVRIRSSKEFSIRGVSPAVGGVIASIGTTIMHRCLVRTALRPPPQLVAWHISVPPLQVAVP